MNSEILSLNKKIISCNKCPRLIKFRKKILRNKRKKFINDKYWGKPITGFGDVCGEILFVGLAPAAHGATRTGRVFTGDKSSEFLYRCLYKAKISNQNTSEHLHDGLKLHNAFITAALKCVPPEDKPEKKELVNCFNFFEKEINIMTNLKIIIALGKVAFDTCIEFYRKKNKLNYKFKFKHGKKYKLSNRLVLIGCYHPSPRNVNTGRINEKKMTNLFKKIKKDLNYIN